MVAIFLALAFGALVSEDLTCIAAGVLIHQGKLDPVVGIAACALGIYVGDLGLYLAGRLAGARALAWTKVRRHLTPHREARFNDWFARNAAAVVLGSRFLPGSRLPLYLASGAFGGSFRLFAWWSFVAVTLWAPVVVLVSAQYNDVAANPLSTVIGDGWPVVVAASISLFAVWRVIGLLTTRRGRQRLVCSISRVWRWEFWPMWLFYAPVAVWIACLSIRHRGIRPISAANPGIADGGIVGESKHDILSRLPLEWTIPSVRIASGARDERVWQFVHQLANRGWTFPLVFKPDMGQRGAGVKVVRNLTEAGDYLGRESSAVLVQPYHNGPFEAGVFYYRYPGWSRGRILSITDKHFPFVVGDGRSTLEELIWAHERLRMQAATFLLRHADRKDFVLPAGESFQLAVAGNHVQGTLFRDGRHLITSELEERIDTIAQSYKGFFVGRFDIRYTDPERFKAGEDLAIVELNGATAESTNIYDPAGSLFAAYRQLFRQWSLVFAIGKANLQNGARSSGLLRVFELLRAHWNTRVAYATSD